MAEIVGHTSQEVWDVYLSFGRNVSATARYLEITRSTVYHHLRQMPEYDKPAFGGQMRIDKPEKYPLPKKGTIARYFLSSAQNNTLVPDQLWENILTLCSYYGADLMVGSFSYNKNAYGPVSVKRNQHEGSSKENWYDERLEPYFVDKPVQLAPGLRWCGEMNILPTAVRPLSGLVTYTGSDSGIFPHTRIAMDSVANSKHDDPKFNYTTGCLTKLNYIKKLAGLKAEFHHTYGGLLVEVDGNGDWFVRQVNADDNWNLYELDICVKGGEVTKHSGILALTPGDLHSDKLDPVCANLLWQAEDSMVDVLNPKEVHAHDLLDFSQRSHWNIKDAHKQFKAFVQGNTIIGELENCREILNELADRVPKVVVINSNHDRHLERWLREADFRKDPMNAEFYLSASSAYYTAIRERRDKDFVLLEWALKIKNRRIKFLKRDESYRVANIECGQHGDEGANGTKGTLLGFSKMGAKMNIADKHTGGIMEGVYMAGHMTTGDLGYNHGPSSWTQTVIVTYPNGKRTLVTFRNGKWRAT